MVGKSGRALSRLGSVPAAVLQGGKSGPPFEPFETISGEKQGAYTSWLCYCEL